ncbi:uncharacterized protein LOC143347142 [Colletes latitarsis]|uniref:uncharacterized protein LOC143347142 n=1 Tax=Colletes latitarsis TaxID=2605962 RepID=UPI0040352905
MPTEQVSDSAVKLTAFFMKGIGLWSADNDVEQRQRNFALGYTIWATVFGSIIEIRDLYYSREDIDTFLYVICNVLCLTLINCKFFLTLARRMEFIDLLTYVRDRFWNNSYYHQEAEIITQCRKTSIFFVAFVTITAHGPFCCYMAAPIIANIGKNESDRILPFNMWVDLPITITPYFEILFFLQAIALYPLVVCYFCFDNIICIMCMQLSGQFRILQYRLTTLYQAEEEKKDVNANISVTYRADQSYEKLKNCVRQHQMLIDCCARLENVFTFMILAQVVIFSVLICFTGFQLLSETTTIARRCNFAFITIASSIMLLMFTYSCHGLVDQSDNVGIAAYSALWAHMPMNRAGKMIRNDLSMVIIRSRKYCCVTANGFFPIALETFTKEAEIIAQCRKTCFVFTIVVTAFAHAAISCYIMAPIIANVGKNESDRILPFNMWVDLPVAITPYYEIAFVVQVITLYPIGVCYFCFDNILCIICVHLAGQFRILQYRLTTLYQAEEEKKDANANISVTYRADQSYEKLKNCVRQHQMLIDCCTRLENVFTLMILAQVVIFSVLICFTGFQILSETTSTTRRCNFTFTTIGSSIMLLMFTYSCHGLVDQSDNVGIAAYSALWAHMPMNRAGKMIRNDLLMIIIRSRKYCCVTANGFFPIALETYTKIMSTAVSYFTLLRQTSDTAIES